MISTFEDAWRLYRAAEVRLPRAPAPHALPPPKWVEGLRSLLGLGRYDAVVLDAWGVLNLGEHPIPPAREAFAALRESGLAVRVLSNDAGCDPPESSARHGRRGFDVRPEEIVFGLDLMAATLDGLGIAAEDCVLVAPRPAPQAALTARMLDPHDARAIDAPAIVLLSNDGYTHETDARLRALLRQRMRPLIVCNPDIVSPEPVGLALEPGLFAHRLADDLGFEPIFLGKPFGGVYDAVLRTLPGVRPDRVLCVGDTLHTDVLGGAAAGMDTLLVESGFFRGEDVMKRAVEAGILPTYWARHL